MAQRYGRLPSEIVDCDGHWGPLKRYSFDLRVMSEGFKRDHQEEAARRIK